MSGKTTGLDYLRANGVSAYTLKRESRNPGRAPESKMVVVLDKVGSGRDMMNCCRSEAGDVTKRTLTEERFNLVFMRLLARVMFFHSNEKRPFIDLKLENLIPIFDGAGKLIDIQLIDCESSLGNRFTFTTSMYSAELTDQCMFYLEEYGNELPQFRFDELSLADFDALANIYGFLYTHFVGPGAFSVKFPEQKFEDGSFDRVADVKVIASSPAAVRQIHAALEKRDPARTLREKVFVSNPALGQSFDAVYRSVRDWFESAGFHQPSAVVGWAGRCCRCCPSCES